jgi:hypothetical protein
MVALLDNEAIQTVFAPPDPDGRFKGPLLDYMRAVGARRNILLLAFAPKSAGTFFRAAAIYAVEGQLVRFNHALGGRDGRPYLPTVLACLLDDSAPHTVAHLHMQAFTSNRHFLEAFGIRPIVMLRNIPDMLASFLDMFDTDPNARNDGLNCLIPENFLEFDDSKKRDFVIDIIAPWYSSYFATWKKYEDEAPKQVCVLHYPDFLADPAQTLQTALSHAGFAVSREKCEVALARATNQRENLRYNKGVRGRGRDYFSLEQRERLARHLAYYPNLEAWLPILLDWPASP